MYHSDFDDWDDPEAFMEGFDAVIAFDTVNSGKTSEETLEAVGANDHGTIYLCPNYCSGIHAAIEALSALAKEKSHV